MVCAVRAVVQCLNQPIVQWCAVPLCANMHLSYFSRFFERESIMISVA